MKAYPNKHYETNDAYLEGKRMMNAEIDAMTFFRAMLYHKDAPKGVSFDNEADYQAALLDGWTTGVDGKNDKDTDALIKKLKAKK